MKNAPKNGAKKQPIFSTLKTDKKLCKTDNYAKIFNTKKNGFFGAKTPKNLDLKGYAHRWRLACGFDCPVLGNQGVNLVYLVYLVYVVLKF